MDLTSEPQEGKEHGAAIGNTPSSSVGLATQPLGRLRPEKTPAMGQEVAGQGGFPGCCCNITSVTLQGE